MGGVEGRFCLSASHSYNCGMRAKVHRILVAATLTALVFGRDAAGCCCSAKVVIAAPQATSAVPAEPKSCCSTNSNAAAVAPGVADAATSEGECSVKLAAKSPPRCLERRLAHWKSSCCCVSPTEQLAPTRSIAVAVVHDDVASPIALAYTVVPNSQTLRRLGPADEALRAPQPSFSILYGVWRN